MNEKVNEASGTVSEPLRSRLVMAGGVRTHYTEAGDDGPPLVLLHGGSPGNAGGLAYGSIMPILATRFRVFGLDGVGGVR